MTANNTGRPRKIATPAEFDRMVDAYVADCYAQDQPVLLTGMVLALGLTSRRSFNYYAEYDGFGPSVERAKLLIEHSYEQRLLVDAKPTGAIFGLKNMGWTDRSELDLSGKIGVTWEDAIKQARGVNEAD